MKQSLKSKTIIGGLLLCSLTIGAGVFADHDNIVHHSGQRISLASNNKELAPKAKKSKNIMEQIKPEYEKYCTYGNHKGSQSWSDPDFISKIQDEIKQVYDDKNNDDLHNTGAFSKTGWAQLSKQKGYKESYDAHMLAGLYDGISGYYQNHKHDTVSPTHKADRTSDQNYTGNLTRFPSTKMNDISIEKHGAARKGAKDTHVLGNNNNVETIHETDDNDPLPKYTHYWYAFLKSKNLGNYDEGAPYHKYSVKGFINNGPEYSQYLGYWHSHLETTNLEHHMGKYSRDVLKVVNPSGNVVVDYPKSTTVKLNGNGQLADDGKKTVVDTVLTVSNLRKYTPWDSEPRSLVFSKNLYAGFMQNGYTDFNVSYQFKDPKTHKDINLGNGQQNPQSNPNTNKNSNAHAFLRFRQINGLGAYYDTKTYKYNGVDAWTNNEYWLQSGSTADKAAEFVNDAGNTGQKEFYVGRHSKIRSINSKVFQDHVIGGQYNSHYPYSKYNNTHDVIFKLNGDSASFHTGSTVGYSNVQPQTKMIGKIKTKYICKKYTYKIPDNTKTTPSPSTLIKYINIVVNRNGQNSKATPLSDFVGKDASQHVNQTMFKHTTVNGQTNGDGGNYKKATILVGPKGNQHREFKNDKQAVKWSSNISCLVIKPPKQQPCKQGSKQCPTSKFKKTVMKKGPDGSIHVPDHEIEDNQNGDYYNGGILKHPNQKYDYKIHGQLPLLNKQAYHNNYGIDKKGHAYYISTTYYNDLRDNFVLNDTIPSEVKMLSVPQMKVNGQSISANSGMSHNMQFKLNESQLANLQSGGTQPTYDVIIPVEAAPKSGSNKDFDSSQSGYGLPDVTGSNYQHWLQFLNKSNFSSDVHVGDHGSINQPDSKKSAALVKIKEIKATIYNYNYNKDYYPNSEQPYGFNFNKSCNKTSTNPTSRYYKDYRYHSKKAKAHKIGNPLYYYGYVNSDFAVRSLKQDQGNHNGQNGTQQWRYRLVYPSLSAKGYLPATNSSENNNNVWNINSQRYKLAKKFISDDWSKKDPNYWADNDNANNALPMVFNPDDSNGKCGNDAYSSSGFSQTNYIPYIVPHISFIPEIPDELKNLPKTARLNRDGQLIIDTDSAKHGLPFRFNMRAQNVLYGSHFWEDFKDDNGNPDMVTMHVTAGKNGPELYKATRRLVGNKSNALARFNGYKRQHYVTKDEWPKGDSSWNGYNEANAFKLSDNSKYKSDYNLDTSKLNLKKGQKIPIHVYFTTTGLARISHRVLNSHAYNAAKPKVMRKTNKSFGYNHNVSDGNDKITGNNPNKSTYIEPERTVKYLGQSPYSYDKKVRELKEELNVTQPHYAYGKTGYGMTANDLGVSYAGHLEEPRYVHKGTNMTYAFPSPFQKKDTHIKYSKDNRHSGKLNATIYKNDNRSTKTAYKRLADVLLHVEPHSQSHRVTTSNGIDNGMPANLDDINGVRYHTDADNYYADFLNKEHLWSGKFATSYGFYPRQATHNIRTSNNGIDSNGGDITIAPHGPSGVESRRYDDKPVSDKTNTNIFGVSHNVNGFNGYGLNGITTNNGAHHIITKSQGIKDAQMSNEDIKADGQDERMFTPIFMRIGSYSTNFHRSYRQMNRKHRLGGNFFDIDENRPIKFYGHIYISKNSKSKDNDEFSLQPILSNTQKGISQTPLSAPLFPNDWLSSADGSMAPNWYDAKIFAKKHKHHGHKRWSMNIGTHAKELEKKY